MYSCPVKLPPSSAAITEWHSDVPHPVCNGVLTGTLSEEKNREKSDDASSRL
jgi:hypothetical protein